MTLVPNWRRVLRHAWSIRLMLLAGLLSGAEAALPLFTPSEPPHWWGWLTLATVAAAFVARVVAQPEIHKEGDGDGSA